MQESLGLLLSRPQPQNNGASNPQHSDCPPAQPSSAPSSPTPTESSPDEQNPNLSSQTESSPSPPPSTRPSVPQPGASHIQATNSASDTLPDPLIPPPVQQTSLHSEPPDGDTGTRDTDAGHEHPSDGEVGVDHIDDHIEASRSPPLPSQPK